MVDILLLIGGTIVVGGICVSIGHSSRDAEVKNAKSRYQKAEDRADNYAMYYSDVKRRADHYQREYELLIGEYNDLVREYKRVKGEPKKVNINTEDALVKKAIRKAMMDAHPDRSGSNATADEFMAYKKMWDKLK